MKCGVDEAGRGPMLGPLVVGAVWCGGDEILKRIGVRDSKQLSPEVREHIYARIDRDAPHWEVVALDAAGIDDLMPFQSLNMIELGMFREACSRHPSDIVYADCPDVDTDRFGRILSVQLGGRKVVAEHKADVVYPVVSAASIMAKVTRDRAIEEIQREFGEPVGSGYPSDPVTVAFVENWIKEHDVPPKHARRSWESVRKMVSASKNASLDDW